MQIIYCLHARAQAKRKKRDKSTVVPSVENPVADKTVLSEALAEDPKVDEGGLEKDSEHSPRAAMDDISPDSPPAADPKPPGPSAASRDGVRPGSLCQRADLMER